MNDNTKKLIAALAANNMFDEIELLMSNDDSATLEPTPTSLFKKGDYVIVRARDAGVHCGRYVSHNGRTVQLTDSRRLWYWVCNNEHSLSGLARNGLKDTSQISGVVPNIEILDACEIIEVLDSSTFESQKIHNRK